MLHLADFITEPVLLFCDSHHISHGTCCIALELELLELFCFCGKGHRGWGSPGVQDHRAGEPSRGVGVRWYPGRGKGTSYGVRLLSAAGEALPALLSPARRND